MMGSVYDVLTVERLAELYDLGFTDTHTDAGWTAVRQLGRYTTTIKPAVTGWRVSTVRDDGRVERSETWPLITVAVEEAQEQAVLVDLVLLAYGLHGAEAEAEMWRAA